MNNQKKKKKKQNKSFLAAEIESILKKSMKQALDAAFDEILKEWK